MEKLKRKALNMKRQIKNFSNYYWKDGNVYNKETNKLVEPKARGIIQLKRDDGKWCLRGLKKISRHFAKGFKTYKQLEKERGVQYKQVYNHPGYLFCQDVEDQFKVWSKYNKYYITPCRIKDNNHLRYSVDGRRMMFYTIVWQYHNQKPFPKGYILHHIDENEDNQDIDNLQMMTRAEHNRLHKKGKHWKKKLHI